MNTWRDGKFEYSSDNGNVQKVKRNEQREAEEAANRKSRQQVQNFNMVIGFVIVSFFAVLLILLVLKIFSVW